MRQLTVVWQMAVNWKDKWYDADELREQIKEKILEEAPLFKADSEE